MSYYNTLQTPTRDFRPSWQTGLQPSRIDRTTSSQWRHVDTKRNPADEASRGQRADELIANNRWFNGPDFLKESEDKWPINAILLANDDCLELRREPKIYASYVPARIQSDIIARMFNRRSRWYELRRDTAWLLRVRCRLRDKAKRTDISNMKIPISVEEINEAEIQIVKLIQQEAFPREASADVSTNKADRTDEQSFSAISVGKTSQLYKLESVKSKQGSLCVGGRLPTRHPSILPKHHPVVDLIVRHYHAISRHAGREYIHALCREKYWIIDGRFNIRRILASCVHCKARRAKPLCQRMADLPNDRITADHFLWS